MISINTMKTKDQRLLEEAYIDIMLDEKINWKGALTAGAMAAMNLLGGNQAQAADSGKTVSGVEQAHNHSVTAEDLIPRAEFNQVLDMMREAVKKGDLKTVKQIYNFVHKECVDAVGRVSGSGEIKKIAAMDAEALKIWNDAYLGLMKGGISAVGDAIKGSM